jgi:peptidoglycan/xylan/chitin deacetylase (PgdA/CDA1 family)
VFAPSVWRGPRHRRALALTFDDGPTPATATLLDVLARYRVRATFFQCGEQVRRNLSVARELASAGHETGNHTDTHARLWFRSPAFVRKEVARAQESIASAAGRTPVLFRAPYGVRWPGLGSIQRELGLVGVMWTSIGRDWTLGGAAVAARVLDGAVPGAILCLHDGRELARNPDIQNTLEAVQLFVPRLIDEGWEFVTVGELLNYPPQAIREVTRL